MSDEPRGCLEIIKWWLFAPCSDDETSFRAGNYDPRAGGVNYRVEDGLPRGRAVDLSDPEKGYYQVYYDQPRPTSPPRAAPPPPRSESKGRLQKQSRKGATAEKKADMGWIDWNFLSGKRKRKVARRPRISTPSNFQHIGSGAINFRPSVPDGPRTAPEFRPLQLSIYNPDNRISPLLPFFAGRERSVSPPVPARSRSRSRSRSRDVFVDDDSTTLAHSRNTSTLSFHIPRRPVGDSGSLLTESIVEETPPRIPPRAKTRPRAYTSPSVEAIVERIASAIIEREILDAELESVKSRHSLCLSRPSTSYDPDEPMPPFPAVPPSAPSFAERVSIERPRTAPSTQTAFQPPPIPPMPVPQSFPERTSSLRVPKWQANPVTPDTPSAVRQSAFNSHPPDTSPKIIDNSIDVEVPLAPPLPLILRPPLRKKKSFSRVSDWLFPAGMEETNPGLPTPLPFRHSRRFSRDSITNAPRALTDKEGFYQTLPPSAIFSGRRSSFDSASDVSRPFSGSIYSTDDDHAGGGTNTVATSTHWSPGSTPPEPSRRMQSQFDKVYARESRKSLNLAIGGGRRQGPFGSVDSDTSPAEEKNETRVQVSQYLVRSPLRGPRPTSVGVAF
ncbi:hypothetical protein M406DRAFT_350250 [Cryphonectria parasitica EP155]|uniref:Uncharacterized protein n=1 Tax=Cryphonectria parasitica (strain ATCC 38755 / EP155) TaxID=660469 RepID=A0A9P4Y4I0_CRYP1|nr:uncharacterized protein M406DRAFT_350250 [Cryphonectria parasitica EP155]KAF3766777.1 hypothetical protein M406DRAFT_350250 [Cryphonectria parasitica EP155]